MLNITNTGLLMLGSGLRIDKNTAKNKKSKLKYDSLEEAYDRILNEEYGHEHEVLIHTQKMISIAESNSTLIWNRVAAFQDNRFGRDKGILNMFKELWKRLFVYNKGMDPEVFFRAVKETFETLPEHEFNKEAVLEQLKICENTLQRAVQATISIGAVVAESEAKLKAAGFDKYQSEEAIVEFIKNSKSGLCMVELQYFKFEVPEDVVAKLAQAENVEVFDNYYVLFTDPEWKKEVKKREELSEALKKKDPIIFGVMQGSHRLYYVADWLSDYCKLTYAELLKTNKDTRL